MVSDRKTRVAVVGASGIGKHHAKWWNLEGVEVCAFVGTSDASVAKTRGALCAMFPFQGRGYTSLRDLISAESPDIVDVCSPADRHFEHAGTALKAGIDVLCEKPFVFDRALSHEALLTQARRLVTLARDAGLRLGVCTQYAVCARILMEMWGAARPGEALTRLAGQIESPARGREPDPVRVWVDLAPHCLSVAQAVFPGAEIAWSTVTTSFEGYDARAEFMLRPHGAPPVQCEIAVRNVVGGGNLRRFTFNDVAYQIEGENDAQGVYNARIEMAQGNRVEPDMMRLLIREYLAGRPPADGAAGVVNLEMLLGILSASGKA
ncbi:MAG: Gfo/Idh/MocA family oxidoreductase [Candidatus Hydrogenedentes bacterium]|nr:Gfo/Idh/MocA family oxidoreductase [Candidatus Hydrogenedentota bacterium]